MSNEPTEREGIGAALMMIRAARIGATATGQHGTVQLMNELEAALAHAREGEDGSLRALCEIAGFAHSGIESLEDARQVARAALAARGSQDASGEIDPPEPTDEEMELRTLLARTRTMILSGEKMSRPMKARIDAALASRQRTGGSE